MEALAMSPSEEISLSSYLGAGEPVDAAIVEELMFASVDSMVVQRLPAAAAMASLRAQTGYGRPRMHGEVPSFDAGMLVIAGMNRYFAWQRAMAEGDPGPSV